MKHTETFLCVSYCVSSCWNGPIGMSMVWVVQLSFSLMLKRTNRILHDPGSCNIVHHHTETTNWNLCDPVSCILFPDLAKRFRLNLLNKARCDSSFYLFFLLTWYPSGRSKQGHCLAVDSTCTLLYSLLLQFINPFIQSSKLCQDLTHFILLCLNSRLALLLHLILPFLRFQLSQIYF